MQDKPEFIRTRGTLSNFYTVNLLASSRLISLDELRCPKILQSLGLCHLDSFSYCSQILFHLLSNHSYAYYKS